MMNRQKSHTHKQGENTPSFWWYDDAEQVCDYEKRIEMKDGFTKILRDPQTRKEVPRAVPLDRQAGRGMGIQRYFPKCVKRKKVLEL